MNPNFRRISPAMVVAVGAMIVALSGSALAVSAHHSKGNALISNIRCRATGCAATR